MPMKNRPHYISSFLAPLLLVGIALLNVWGYMDAPRALLSNPPYVFNLSGLQVPVWNVLSGLVLIFLLLWMAAILVRVIGYAFGRIQIENRTVLALLRRLINVAIYTLFILIAIDILGLEIDTLLVLFGGLGVGIGIGLQRITSNFFSGVLLLMEGSYRIGDLIELPGVYGFVRRIALRYTLVETFDGREVLVPNEELVTAQVMNWTLSHTRGRVEIEFGVAYGSDLRRVMDIALAAARGHASAASGMEPLCFLREFGDNSINFLLIFQVQDVRDGKFGPQSDVMLEIHDQLERAGIQIPFPQRDVHLIRPDEG